MVRVEGEQRGEAGGGGGMRPNENPDNCKPVHATVRHKCIFVLYAKPG